MTGPAAISTAAAVPDARLRKAAQGFEAVFLREIISAARKSSLGNDIFGSMATDRYREMADAQMADAIAQQGRFGIAKLIEAQLSQGGGKP